MTAEDIIRELDLQPLEGEGGYYRRTWLSENTFISPHSGEKTPARPIGSVIYYLLTGDPNSFSAMHKLKTDETWHFYLGDPVRMLLLYPDGSSDNPILGQNISGGEHVQFIVPREVWQGAGLLSGGKYGFALMGTTMAPAFIEEDFILGKRIFLSEKYPGERERIYSLTRE